METTALLNTLFFASVVLLVLVSGGILYLTSLKWRDRRLQSQERKAGR